MKEALIKITYQEDPAMLEWIDRIARGVSAHRGRPGAVSRADVIRWLTRTARASAPSGAWVELENMSIEQVASQI